MMMLNIWRSFRLPASTYDPAEALHTLIEAKKLAYADLRRHVADPAFPEVPVTA